MSDKLFIIMMGDQYYPTGADDIKGYASSLEEAKKKIEEYPAPEHASHVFDWADVVEVDLNTHEQIIHNLKS